ncbi:MAG: hypothetical protein Kow00121_37250 [Elainellaceae cyanobacterium]
MDKIFAKNQVSYNHLWISFTQPPMNYRHAKRSPVALRQTAHLLSAFLLGLLLSWAGRAVAQTAPPAPQTAPTPETTPDATPPAATPDAATPAENSAPSELLETLAAIDAAATQHDIEAVMNYFSPSFTNSDGLTYASLEQTLSEFWERYPTVIYETQLNNWQADGNAIVAETTTTITGVQTSNDQPVNLTATITSRQRFENSQIVEQEILSEQSQLAQGENPPDVNVILPDQVAVGESFEFDAIVQEPLGNRLLLGAALEEPVQPNGYFDENPVTLELLSSGGLFKIGEAPATPDTHWVSAILIRDDGITTVTRRLQVVPAGSASQAPAEP